MLADYSGQRLKELRLAAGLTQLQVVKEAGLSEAALCYIENGRRRPKRSTIKKLLDLYTKKIKYWQRIDKALSASGVNMHLAGERDGNGE